MEMEKIKIDQIKPNEKQPRKYFTGVDELASSIKEKGLLEPIMVRPIAGRYEIVHGQRRWLAAQKAGLVEIDAIVKDATDQEAYEMAIIENVQRENLTPMEEALAFKDLQANDYTQQDIANMIGKGQSYVAHKLRLLKLPEPITFYLERGALTENHVRQIIKIRDVYGADLPRGISENPNFEDSLPVKESLRVSEMLTWIRPEGKMVWFGATNVIIEAVNHFLNYVSKHNANVMQWEVAGFWWASLAVSLDLSVADLTLSIDKWRERYKDCRAQWYLYRCNPALTQEKDETYWALHHDMRHSASLNADSDIADNPEKLEILLKRIKRIAARGSWCLPSELQITAEVEAEVLEEKESAEPELELSEAS
jgi:ParB/RepB/Spo0J family partition protein